MWPAAGRPPARKQEGTQVNPKSVKQMDVKPVVMMVMIVVVVLNVRAAGKNKQIAKMEKGKK